MNYDFLIRSKQWDKVIQKAQKKSPNTPMSVADLNLALAKTGQMSDHMFDFFQRDPQGLLPDFQRDFTLPLVTSEIYYQLGFVNTAQRYAFEAMEATPDYQKSGRVLRRLAETNLINGEYKVAYKYLKILQKSLFYRKFANRTMGLLWNEKAINADPEYAWLRKCRPQKDFLFSEAEKDMKLPHDDPADYGYGPNNGRPVYFCTGKPQQRGKFMNATTGVASTAGKFASDFALGSQILKSFYPKFAEIIGHKATDAYQQGVEQPGNCQTVSVVSPYIYEEDNWVDDMELGAMELYHKTGDKKYLDQALEYGRREPMTP